MILWALGLALAAPPTAAGTPHTEPPGGADGHGHEAHCPAAHVLAAAVGRRALSPPERACVAKETNDSARGNAYGWVGLVDRALHQTQSPTSEELQVLREHTAQASTVLTAARQLESHPELQEQALMAARDWLAAQAWNVEWSRAYQELEALSTTAAAGLAPRVPSAADLAVCRDVGHLQARALFGGVYAAERDCALRAAEVATGDERTAWARLSWALTVQHNEPEERALVKARLVALQLDPAAL